MTAHDLTWPPVPARSRAGSFPYELVQCLSGSPLIQRIAFSFHRETMVLVIAVRHTAQDSLQPEDSA
jgi:hypothetical protein